MSPTIFYEGAYRFFFFSREEKRIHIHVASDDWESLILDGTKHFTYCKSWNASKDLTVVEEIIKERKDEIKECWRKHFKTEITNVSAFGVWLIVKGIEYFLPYSEYPWFKEARISEILNVQLLNDIHLYWKELDVDIEIDTLKNLEKYPLVYR